MHLVRSFLAIAVMCWAALAPAQPPADSKKPEEPEEQAEVRLTKGSVVRMAILQERLEVVTKYGKLSIPLADVVKIDFGLHVPEDLEKKIAKAIEDLGHENYKTREQALNYLVNKGLYAYPQVYKAAKSDQPEVLKRAQVALDRIKAKHGSSKLRLRDEDIIVTAAFTIIGKITTPTIKARAEVFGEHEIPLADLRSIRSLSTAAEVETTIDASKYANINQWMDSGFEARQGMRMHIAATGTVNLWPQNGGFMSSPSGFTQQGFIQGPGTQHYPGTLLGKIGEGGAVFRIGDRYDGSASADGKLYLHISPSPWSQNQGGSNGSYQVKISPGGLGD